VRDFKNWVFDPTADVESYSGSTDWASVAYGSGYDKCGALKYSIVEDDKSTRAKSYVSLVIDTNENAADNIRIEVQTNNKHNVGKH